MMKQIKKIIFPVAGLGTSLLPATKAMPKEMLPVVDKPLIQYAVEEAVATGITDMIFVTGRYKRAIEDHFDLNPELEAELTAKHKTALLEVLHSVTPHGINFAFIRQPEPLGVGHAVLYAAPAVGNEPFGVILADDLIFAKTPLLKQLIEAREVMGGGNVLAVQDVSHNETTSKYGIVAVENVEQRISRVTSMIKKPASEEASSNLTLIGRYVLEPDIFDRLRDAGRGIGGEIQLTDAIASTLAVGATYAYRFEGQCFDCGSKQGFLSATVHYARLSGYQI